jgi:hypothetical protein
MHKNGQDRIGHAYNNIDKQIEQNDGKNLPDRGCGRCLCGGHAVIGTDFERFAQQVKRMSSNVMSMWGMEPERSFGAGMAQRIRQSKRGIL